MNTINERLQVIADELFGSNISLFEKECGLKPATLKHIVKGRLSKPSYEIIEMICRTIVQLNIDWLIVGRGEMVKSKFPAPLNLSNQVSSTVSLSEYNEAMERKIEQIGELKHEIGRLQQEVKTLRQDKKIAQEMDDVLNVAERLKPTGTEDR